MTVWKRSRPATGISAHCRSGSHGPAAVPAYHSWPDLRHISCSPRRAALYAGSRRKPSCAGTTDWRPSRPWIRCSTSPATCWPGRWNMTVGGWPLPEEDLPPGRENWTEEFDAFQAELRPVVDQMCRTPPASLESDCFALAQVPDAVLAENLHQPRLKAVFPADAAWAGWNTEQARALAQELRPAIPAVTETIGAGTLRRGSTLTSQHPGERPGLVQHARLPADHRPGLRGAVRLEGVLRLLGLFSLYARHPEALAHGHRGSAWCSPRRKCHAGFLRDRRPADFCRRTILRTLVQELVTRCGDDVLTDVCPERSAWPVWGSVTMTQTPEVKPQGKTPWSRRYQQDEDRYGYSHIATELAHAIQGYRP